MFSKNLIMVALALFLIVTPTIAMVQGVHTVSAKPALTRSTPEESRSNRNGLPFQAHLIRTIDVASLPRMVTRGPGPSPSVLAGQGSSSVSMVTGFSGLSVGGPYNPPDPQVASGPNDVFEMVNAQGEIFSKGGMPRGGAFNLTSFFGDSPGTVQSDPKILYDVSSGRWFASIIVFRTTLTTEVDLAVSASNDPNLNWRIYGFPGSPTGPSLTDQPILGINDDKVTVAFNEFDVNSVRYPPKLVFAGATYNVVNKQELVSGSPLVDSYAFGPDISLESVHPVRSLSPTTTEFMVSTGGPQLTSGASTRKVQLYSVNGVPPGPVTVSNVSLTVSLVATAPDGVEPSGTVDIARSGIRVLDAIWYQGTLWYSLNDACTPAGDAQSRSCVRLTQIDTASKRVTQDFDYGANGQYFFYPALSINGNGGITVIYGYSSSTIYPSLASTGQAPSDPLNSLSNPITLVSGTASGGGGRYGDYFGAGTDPSDTANVWVAGEYITASSAWSTYIASIRATSGADFGMDPSPGGFTFAAGSTGVSTITIQSLNSYTGTISLTVSVSPNGPSPSLSANQLSVSAGSSATATLTVATGSNLAGGSYNVTVTGTDGILTHWVTVEVNVKGFYITANPSVSTFAAGSSATSTLSVASVNGYSGTINLAVSVSPTGPTITLSATSVTVSSGGKATSILTVSTTSSTPRQFYTISVTATASSQSSSATLTEGVTPIPVAVTSVNIFQDNTRSVNLTITTTQTLSIDSPSNQLTVSGSISVSSSDGASNTFTITQLPFGSLTLLDFYAESPYALSPIVRIGGGVQDVKRLIDINANGVVDQADLNIVSAAFGCNIGQPCYNPRADLNADGTVNIFDLVIVGANFGLPDILPDFAISVSQTTVYTSQGLSDSSTIVTLQSTNGFVGSVSLSATLSQNGPAGRLLPTASLSPATLSLTAGGSGTSTLTVTVPSKAYSCDYYYVTILATSGALTHFIIVKVSVTPNTGV